MDTILSKPAALSENRYRAIWLLIIATVIFVLCVVIVHEFFPIHATIETVQRGEPYAGIDFRLFSRNVRLLFSGQYPYFDDMVHNPPWLFLIISPLVLLPEDWGVSAFIVIGCMAYAYVALRLGASPFTLLLFLLSPTVLGDVKDANIGWLVSLGFLLPPEFGLLLVMLKPQVGLGIALFWAWGAWKKAGAMGVIKIFLPVTILYAASALIFYPWPFSAGVMALKSWNRSLFPYAIPVALLLIAVSIYKEKKELAIAASPFMAPYVAINSYAPVLFPFLRNNRLMLFAFLANWGIWILLGYAPNLF